MKPGDRVIVTGGPWGKRIGKHGVIAEPQPDIYPWYGLGKNEEVVLLDGDKGSKRWTMVISRAGLTPYHWKSQ